MHPQELIDLVVTLEQDLAAFYERIEKKLEFDKIRSALQYMHKHSAIHAELIRNHRPEARLPVLNIEPFQKLHERVKSVLYDQLMTADNLTDVCDQLANAEANLSQAYDVVALHLQKVSDVYAKLASKFKSLADDEMRHHDHLLKQSSGGT